MGQQDWKDDRARRLAARYPDRAQPGAVTHVVVDGEDFAVSADTIESTGEVPADIAVAMALLGTPVSKKGGRPKGSKNKAKD